MNTESKILDIFSKNLKRLRNERNISQEKLAELIGVSHNVVSLYECKKTLPRLEKIEQIAEVFHIPYCELLMEENLLVIREDKLSSTSKKVLTLLVNEANGGFSDTFYNVKH